MTAGWVQLLTAAALFISIPFTLALVTDNVLKVLLLFLIAISFTWAYRSDRDRAIRQRLKELDDDDHKILALLNQINDCSYTMEVQGASLWFLILVTGSMSGIMLATWFGLGKSMLLLVGVVLILACLLLLVRQMRIAGKPMFSIYRQGIFVNQSGEVISWQEIERVSMTEVRGRSVYLYHILGFHPSKSTSRKPRTFILKPGDESPEAIFGICERLLEMSKRPAASVECSST